MDILPLNPAENAASPEALRGFLATCRDAAERDRHDKLVSISLALPAPDPLAVLELIFDPAQPHFYAERPSIGTALAGAEVAVRRESSGAGRFRELRDWAEDTLAHTIAVGDVNAPLGGPHFFTALAFREVGEPGQPFPAASSFVPRWQVALAGGTGTAVANLVVGPDSDLEALALRVWRAHRRLREVGEGGGAGAARPGTARPARFALHEAGDYRAAVARALERIGRGEISKVVLARAIDLLADQPLHPLVALNGLRQRFPDCYSFSFSDGRGPSFIGASPERLLRVSRGVLETEALAGSAPRGGSASEDAALAAGLTRSEKDRREHEQVLADIRARLEPLVSELEATGAPQVRRLANVQHLLTPVRGLLRDGAHPLDVLAELHPTPAVGGAPRTAALAAIRELEGFPRGLYAGALGWLNARRGGEFFVGLRSALVDGRSARLYAGAGIVAGSTPEKEFAETELKFRAMLGAIGAPLSS